MLGRPVLIEVAKRLSPSLSPDGHGKRCSVLTSEVGGGPLGIACLRAWASEAAWSSVAIEEVGAEYRGTAPTGSAAIYSA